VNVTTDGGTIDAEQVLMAVGRAAKVKDVGLEKLGVSMDAGLREGVADDGERR
jgi:pyruvate/2-oxoglutarate dehydrogenase complex dihydrolipoamide dehydrogenase (E3) component